MLCRPKNKNQKNNYLSTPLRILVLAALVTVGIAYVWQISQVSTQGYYLKDLERQVSILEKQNERLSFEMAELNSMARIETAAKTLGMVKSDSIVYLTQTVDSVALKP
jgi:cell division protein FtsL